MSGPYDYESLESLKRLACRCVSKKGTLAKLIEEEEGVKVCFADLFADNLNKFCEHQGQEYRVKSGKLYWRCEYSKESAKGNEDSGAH